MEILMAFVLSLPGLLGQAETSPSASTPKETPQVRPLLPGESGHILKMTREMLELAKTRDSERRMDLFLRQAQERLREREALENVAPALERDRLSRGLVDSYAKLTATGAAGAIECGAAEGRDMSAPAARYVEAVRGHQETWSRLAGAQPAEERVHYDGVLAVSAKAPERVREAQEAGKAFAAQEQARDRQQIPAAPKDPTSAETTRTALPRNPSDPKPPPPEAGRRDADKDTRDAPSEASGKDDRKEDRNNRQDSKDPKTPEHHPTHPHRPHR